MKKRNYLLIFSALMVLMHLPLRVSAQDVQAHWASETMNKLSEQGVIKGYQDGSFRPDHEITRAEFITLVNRMMKFEETSDVSFTDVKEEDWFAKEVKIAYTKGYIKGYQDGSFMPNANLNRAEAAVMMSRLSKGESKTMDAVSFHDAAQIPAWASEAITMAVNSGYIKGYPDGSFKPENKITRAEAFTLLSAMAQAHEMKNTQEMQNSQERKNTNPNDVIVEMDKSVVEKKTVKGDVIISERLGEGSATLKDLTIEGNLIVQGGGMHSLYMENVKVKGKIVVEKKNVRVQLMRNTLVDLIEVKTPALISSDKFSGKVKNIHVAVNSDELKATDLVDIKVKADTLRIDEKANVKVQEDIKNIEIQKSAEGTTLEVTKNATISSLKSEAKATVSGEGRVEKLSSNSSNANLVKLEKTVKVGKKVPSFSGGASSSGGSSGGSSDSGSAPNPPAPSPDLPNVSSITINPSPADITEDDGIVQMSVSYSPSEAKNKGVKWTVTKGDDVIRILSKDNNSIQIQALDNGKYHIEARLESNRTIAASVKGTVSNQVVKIIGGPQGLVAGDKKITGVQKGKSYVLQVDGKYFALDAYGIKTDAFDTLEVAKLYAVALRNVIEIQGLDNSKSYYVHEVVAKDLFEQKLEHYLKIKPEDITIKNVQQIEALRSELKATIEDKALKIDNKVKEIGLKIAEIDQETKKIDEQIEALEQAQPLDQQKKSELEALKAQKTQKTQEKQELEQQREVQTRERDSWEAKKQKLEELKEKISEMFEEIEKITKAIAAHMDKINEKNLSVSEIRQELIQIDALLASLPESSKPGVALVIQNLGEVKEEVALFEELDSIELTLNKQGVLTLFKAPSVDVTVVLYQDGGRTKEFDLSANQSSLNLLKEMRDWGVGSYRAGLKYNFMYFNPVFSQTSNTQEVAYLKKIDSLELIGPNFTKKPDSTDKVEIDFEAGLLKWDSVENAQYYDIVGEITIVNNSIKLGKYYVQHKPTDSALPEFSSQVLNNTEELLKLPLHEYKGRNYPLFIDGSFSTGYLRVAANIENKKGVKTNSISLSEFIHIIRNEAQAGEPENNDPTTLDIFIIPRNIDGLYLTNTEEFKGKVKKTVYIAGISYKDYLDRFKF